MGISSEEKKLCPNRAIKIGDSFMYYDVIEAKYIDGYKLEIVLKNGESGKVIKKPLKIQISSEA